MLEYHLDAEAMLMDTSGATKPSEGPLGDLLCRYEKMDEDSRSRFKLMLRDASASPFGKALTGSGEIDRGRIDQLLESEAFTRWGCKSRSPAR